MTRAERERRNKLARVHREVAATKRRGWSTRGARDDSPRPKRAAERRLNRDAR